MRHPIETLIREARESYARDLERACEASLQMGVCGVLVTWKRDGTYVIRVDAAVPYGEIWERR